MGTLDDRRLQSEEGLSLVRAEAERRLPQILGTERLAIYVTGSFGRGEAAFPKKSDLDLFFLYGPEAEDPEAKLSNLLWVELASEVIKIARELDFEDFSRDGEYLKWHNVWRIGSELGSQTEDAENGFTARLLLLLESQPVLNPDLYQEFLLRTIGFYFRDYPANRDDFRPTFLINDILRFWRTLCLNYENARNRKRESDYSEEEQTRWRAESAANNVKLRFSRLSTCFSMVAALSSQTTSVTPERVLELSNLPPIERWEVAAGGVPSALDIVATMRGLYEWFLELTEHKDVLVAKLADHDERRAVRSRADEYGELVARLLLETAAPKQMRFLLI